MKVKSVLIAIASIVVVLVGAYLIQNGYEAGKISDGLTVARVAIDADKVARINTELAQGYTRSEMLRDQEYKDLVQTLNRLSEAFPVGAKWSYIATAASSRAESRLVILTVHADETDTTTLPGYIYDIAPYPAMQRAIYDPDEIVVSNIVWDKTYKILTRSGFIKLYDSEGNVVGVLGVDIETGPIFKRIASALFATIAYSALLLLVFFRIAPSLSLSKRQRKILITLERHGSLNR